MAKTNSGEQYFSTDKEESNVWEDFIKNFSIFPDDNSQKINFQKTKKNFFWTIGQNQIYCEFLKINKEELGEQKARRATKIFKKMSEYLSKSGFEKTSDQCRGHHKKMMKKHKSIEETIDHISNILDNQVACYFNMEDSMRRTLQKIKLFTIQSSYTNTESYL